ncbi:M36 family metallopeptidase [Photobacterium angustum]|uniref:Peptidase M36 n=1 Tax=Photobacterium angustum TaxID=661 RepID=A0A2S7VI76_PHOAN|nr:M36 family metallopeptidase [Photobacterium angustum]PQJ61788.1 peptidase M36 [Photobacterium angustum]
MKIIRVFIWLAMLISIVSCNGGSEDTAEPSSDSKTVVVDFTPEFTAFRMAVPSTKNEQIGKNASSPILLVGTLQATNTATNAVDEFDWKAYLHLDTFKVESETTVGLTPGNYDLVLDIEHDGQKYHGEANTDIVDGNSPVAMNLTPVLGKLDTDVSVNPEMAKLFFKVDPNELNLLGLGTPIVGIGLDNNQEMKFLINKNSAQSDLFFNIQYGSYLVDINFYDDTEKVGHLDVPNQALNIDQNTTVVNYDVVPLMGVTVITFNEQGDTTDITVKIPNSIITHVQQLSDLNTELKLLDPNNMIVFDDQVIFTQDPNTPNSYIATLPMNLNFAQTQTHGLFLTLKFFDTADNPTVAFASCTSESFHLEHNDKTLGCQVTFNDTTIDVVTALNAHFVVNVYDVNGNPVKDAQIFIDDATTPIGVTGEDPFTSEGAVVFNTSVGEHDIKAKAIGYLAEKVVNAAPLSINNVDLYLMIPESPPADAVEPRNYDTRVSLTENVNIPPSTEQTNLANDMMVRIPPVKIDYEKRTGVARVLYNQTGYLTDADPSKTTEQVVMDFLEDNRRLLHLSPTDIANVEQQVYETAATGAKRFYLQQKRHGRDVFNALLQVNVNRDGRILSVNNTFSPHIDQVILSKQAPTITVKQAIINAAEKVGIKVRHQPAIENEDLGADDQATKVNAASASREPIDAKLVYVPVKNDELRLAWSFLLFTHDQRHVYQMLVDANSGELLAYFDQVDEHSYEVFQYPVESPNHATPVNARQIEVNPAASPGSPWAWHDLNATIGDEFTIMRGNNVHAYNDSNNSGSPTGPEPDCMAGITCVFPLDFTLPPQDSSEAATANLFHWNNIIHDITYLYGFDQASGNFQVNQYGAPGAGGDDVMAEAQDGGGMNNANFWTPADGTRPRMQMYLWSYTTPQRDGDFDNAIIVHEYAHGISNRLVGGPANVNCLSNYQRPSEGISDLYALMMTQPTGLTGADPRAMGTYVLGQPTSGAGIRPQRYSTDPAVNNYTYESIISGMSVPHGVGSVWAQAAWEVYWALVDEHGFDINLYNSLGGSGNQRAMLYFTEGLKNTICSPSFIDTRDGIIQAAIDNYSGEDVCLIWRTFAGFGLGVDAVSPSSNSLNVTNGFGIPSSCDETADVWVEDTHYDYFGPAPDTGNEPDANMVGKSMWRSKAIWNRVVAGSPGPHQNPEFGQKNEIYVNVKNRGAATAFNTTVEVYWAHASTGLTWPTGWTLLGTDTIGTLPVGADVQATVTWEPPTTGHYCLVARLINPQDPMSFPETASINYNTRQNNNIAWRNMNVVDLLINQQQKISFIARGIDTSNQQIVLQIGHDEQQRFLNDGGRLAINLLEFTGVDEWQEITQLPFIIRNLQTPTGNANEANVQLRFSADPMPITDKESALYHLDVMQLGTTATGSNQEIGGVSYEIITRTHLTDTDKDQKPDIQDDDDDDDQVPDELDAYPLDQSRH